MKRLLMGFATCALIITSCSNNDVMENVADGQNQLSFSPGLGKQAVTKVGELNNVGLKAAAIKGNGIALYAYQELTTDTWTPWYTDKIWYESNKWQIESTRFANTAASKYITFFPADYVSNGLNLATANFTSTFPQFDCVIPNTNDDQKDLIAGLTAVASNQKEITLGMRHILSQINFGVKGYKGAFIQIRDIKIHDVYNKATYTYKKDEAAAPDIIGAWGNPVTFVAGTAANAYTYPGVYTTVPATAVTDDKYIFGDGGNWGPGKNADTFYPVGTSDAWVAGNGTLPPTGMNNSLMLLPQNFTTTGVSNENAYVTFDYKIWDTGSDGNGTNAGYAAGSSTTFAQGRFKLNFNNSGSAYASKWDQNYRYVYIIDFEDFIEDSKLDFTVDVEMYPWLNYNSPSDGIVDVPIAGIPTNTQLNALANDDIWYVASRSKVIPSTAQVQLLQNETWKWDDYKFAGLTTGQAIKISFKNVIFNGKKITITVGSGYKIYIGETEANTQTIEVTVDTQVVTIKKD